MQYMYTSGIISQHVEKFFEKVEINTAAELIYKPV